MFQNRKKIYFFYLFFRLFFFFFFKHYYDFCSPTYNRKIRIQNLRSFLRNYKKMRVDWKRVFCDFIFVVYWVYFCDSKWLKWNKKKIKICLSRTRERGEENSKKELMRTVESLWLIDLKASHSLPLLKQWILN